MKRILLLFALLILSTQSVFAVDTPKLYEGTAFIKVYSSLKSANGQESERLENQKVGEKVTIQHRLYSDEHALTLPVKEVEKNIVLVLDTSRSMGWRMQCDECFPGRDEKSRIQIMKEAAKKFVASLKGKHARISLVSFSNNVYGDVSEFDMTDQNGEQPSKLIARIDALVADGNTNTGAALRQAGQILDSVSSESARFIVLMTDGVPNSINDTIAAASALRGKGFNCYAVGITEVGSAIEDIGVAMGAREVAGGQHYHKALTERDMQNIYRQIYLDIATYLPLKNVRYLEELSGIADVGVVSVVDGNRKPTGDHLKTIKMRDGSTRIDGAIALQLRKNANGLYMLDEKHVFIDVAMNDIGNIQNHTPTAISYVDPFENEKHGVFENSVSIAATDYVLGKLDVTPKKLTIKTNQTGAVSTVFVPSRMRDRRVAWSIEDTTVLKIISSNDAKLVVKGLKRGETRIIARHIESGKEVSADIVVIPFKVDPKKLFGEEPERSGTVDKFIVQ